MRLLLVKLGHQIRWRAHRFYLHHIRLRLWHITYLRPIVRNFDKWQLSVGERDIEENHNTTPADNEEIKLQAIWAVEFYTPSQVSKLLYGLRKLGWAEDPTDPVGPEEWIRRGRQSAYGGGWLNLGVIARKGSNSEWISSRSGRLPENVEFATGAVITVTSSITCVIIQFVFTEEFSACFDRELRTLRVTTTEPLGTSTAILSPGSQKTRAIDRIRRDVRNAAWLWFRQNLGGVFSAEKQMPDAFPTCEMITTRFSQPFPGPDDVPSSARGYLRSLGISDSFTAWDCKRAPGLRFSSYPFNNEQSWVVASLESTLSSRAKAQAMGEGRGGIIFFTDSVMQRFLVRWSILGLLSHLQVRVNNLRDATMFAVDSKKHTIAALSGLIEIEAYGLDVASISYDLQRYTSDPFFAHEVADFEPVYKHNGGRRRPHLAALSTKSKSRQRCLIGPSWASDDRFLSKAY